VVLVDARGLGRSQALFTWKDGIEILAQDCLLVLDQLEIEHFHVFGLSLGGMIGMSLAGQVPERVLSLTVANTSTADTGVLRLNPLALRSLLIGFLQGRFHETLLKQVVPQKVSATRRQQILQAWQDILEDEGFPIALILRQLYAASRFSIRGQLDGTKTPVLILVGSEDRFVPQRHSRRLQELIPGARLRRVEGAGHEITLGHEELLTNILRDFAGQSK
jgi:3-oxoadipate enol-lactonase